MMDSFLENRSQNSGESGFHSFGVSFCSWCLTWKFGKLLLSTWMYQVLISHPWRKI